MYNFKHITYKEIPKLIEYNKQTYPERGGYTKSIIDFWVARHSEAVSDILTVEKDGKFYGQEFYSKMAFYYKGVYEESHWCFDLIVDQKLRKDCIGLDFMQYALEEYPNYYCTGSGPDAVKLHLALGKQLLGDIRKYVGLVNPLWLSGAKLQKVNILEPLIMFGGKLNLLLKCLSWNNRLMLIYLKSVEMLSFFNGVFSMTFIHM